MNDLTLLDDIKRNGTMQGIGKPEPLKHRPGYDWNVSDCKARKY